MERIAIEGIDGSGKTVTCAALSERMQREGLSVVTFAPYRLANELLGSDIYELWFDETACIKAMTTLRDVIRDCEEKAAVAGADVIIYDRHWMSAFTVLKDTDGADSLWEQHGPEPVPTALLRVPIETALERRLEELQHTEEPFMRPDQLGQDAAAYGELARTHSRFLLGIYRSDNDVTPEDLAANIYWDLNIGR